MPFDILGTPGEQFPNNQYQRKTLLRERMQKRTLEGLCHVIRDLTDQSRQDTLNQYDATVLFRAEEHLLDEWVVSLGVTLSTPYMNWKYSWERVYQNMKAVGDEPWIGSSQLIVWSESLPPRN